MGNIVRMLVAQSTCLGQTVETPMIRQLDGLMTIPKLLSCSAHINEVEGLNGGPEADSELRAADDSSRTLRAVSFRFERERHREEYIVHCKAEAEWARGTRICLMIQLYLSGIFLLS
jgi:hypothetical protein